MVFYALHGGPFLMHAKKRKYKLASYWDKAKATGGFGEIDPQF